MYWGQKIEVLGFFLPQLQPSHPRRQRQGRERKPVSVSCVSCLWLIHALPVASPQISVALGSIIFPHADIHRPTVPWDLKQKLRGPGDPKHGVWDKWHGTLTQIWCELAGVCLSCTMGCSWSHSVANHQICHLVPSSQVDMPKGVIVFV